MAKGAKVAIAHPIKKNLARESKNSGVLLSISNFSNFLYVLLKINLEITTVILTKGKNITVTIETNGSITVEDEGRGIPVDVHKGEKKSAAEVIMTQLHSGAKFDQNSFSSIYGYNII